MRGLGCINELLGSFDRLDKDWISQISAHDQVDVASHHPLEALLQLEVPATKCTVIESIWIDDQHIDVARCGIEGRCCRRAEDEQALYADGLSDESLAQLRRLVTQHWQAITQDLVPRIEKMIAADDAAGIGSTAGPGKRTRVGLFSYQTAVQPPAPPARPDAEDAP